MRSQNFHGFINERDRIFGDNFEVLVTDSAILITHILLLSQNPKSVNISVTRLIKSPWLFDPYFIFRQTYDGFINVTTIINDIDAIVSSSVALYGELK